MRGYDADVRAMLARAAQLLRVTFAHVNWLTAPLLPANDNRGSVIAVEAVVRRKSLCRLSRLQPPLGVVGAIALGHNPIIVNLR